MISSEALGEDGREVRCGKCSHMWFQPAERDSLDELRETAEEDDDFNIGLSDRAEAEEIGFQNSFTKVEEPQLPLTEAHETALRHAAGFMIALAVLSIIFYAFILLKTPLSKMVPGLNSAYAAMGFSAPRQVEPDIAFDRIKLERKGDVLTGSGLVINLSENPVDIGGIKAELMGPQKEIIETVDVMLPKKEIAPESSEKIEFIFKAVSQKAEAVRLFMSH